MKVSKFSFYVINYSLLLKLSYCELVLFVPNVYVEIACYLNMGVFSCLSIGGKGLS